MDFLVFVILRIKLARNSPCKGNIANAKEYIKGWPLVSYEHLQLADVGFEIAAKSCKGKYKLNANIMAGIINYKLSNYIEASTNFKQAFIDTNYASKDAITLYLMAAAKMGMMSDKYYFMVSYSNDPAVYKKVFFELDQHILDIAKEYIKTKKV